MTRWPALEKAGYLGSKGVEEDNKKNYTAAVKYYEQCEVYCYYAIKYEARTDKVKAAINGKLKKYQDRKRQLKAYLSRKYQRKTQCTPYSRTKKRKPQPGSIRPCEDSQLNNRLKCLTLKDVNENEHCR